MRLSSDDHSSHHQADSQSTGCEEVGRSSSAFPRPSDIVRHPTTLGEINPEIIDELHGPGVLGMETVLITMSFKLVLVSLSKTLNPNCLYPLGE